MDGVFNFINNFDATNVKDATMLTPTEFWSYQGWRFLDLLIATSELVLVLALMIILYSVILKPLKRWFS